jgi:RNA polymerase sigma-70 factor, ECF subfamily
VRVVEHDPQEDGDSDDGHAASVGGAGASGQLFTPPLNPSPPGGTRAGVTVAAAALSPFSAVAAVPRPEGEFEALAASASTAPWRGRWTSTDDGAVVRRAAAGDAEAFRALFVKHRGDVARLAYRMLSGPSDLEDVVQEVFVQVFRSLKDFRGQSKFSTWLHRVTVNVVLMHRRSARSRPVLTEEAPEGRLGDDESPLPDEDVERRERMRAFQRLLARLADKKRVVFVLHELEGLSPGEIAEIVSAPVLTVRTRLFYARRELEAMLPEEPSLAQLQASLASFTRKGRVR